ncbi:hypothetical protein [Sinomonas flava]|uniref:Uncharacterized protein n=1 Tax=Sinomonas flava TaxID=496857 RepID=A0ABP5NTB4_9MICC
MITPGVLAEGLEDDDADLLTLGALAQGSGALGEDEPLESAAEAVLAAEQTGGLLVTDGQGP